MAEPREVRDAAKSTRPRSGGEAKELNRHSSFRHLSSSWKQTKNQSPVMNKCDFL